MRAITILLGLTLAFQSNELQAEIKADTLSSREQNIVQIASYAAIGDLDELHVALSRGLGAGLTVNEEKEILVHLYAYAGFPRSIRGLLTLLEVLKERDSLGIEDKWGPEASPITDNRTKYDRGKSVLEQLIGKPLAGKPEYQKFSPEMDRFLKEHLFADIFERDVLSHKQRELVTISVIASLGTLEPMLRSHFMLSLNVGWQKTQLYEFTKIIEITAGQEKAESARSVLDQVLDDNRK